ncbi:major facilitator superfamily domain-containing protein 6-like isoform X2 [Tachypleus tridentatus]|uniref:major facilitator superfamily domain-containing protein 6-like isoform X2 n=1 Tax=Tachypleus tridentatus TaxID=6853 RepID=UPI003FD24F24
MGDRSNRVSLQISRRQKRKQWRLAVSLRSITMSENRCTVPTSVRINRKQAKRALIPLKIILFCWYGAAACLLPYLTIHMKQIGISLSETALMYTVLPATQVVGPPLASLVADKMGHYTPVLLIALIVTSVTSTALLFVPPAPPSHEQPPSLHLLCGPNFGSPQIIVDKCWEYGACDRIGYNTTLAVHFVDCLVDCRTSGWEKALESMNSADLCFNDHLGQVCHLVEVNNTLSENFTFSVHLTEPVFSAVGPSCIYSVMAVEWNSRLFHEVTCPIIMQEFENTDNCTLRCLFDELEVPDNSTIISDHIFSDKKCEINRGRRMLTLWVYFILRVLFQIFLAICFSLLDATTLVMVGQYREHYGQQRFWTILATAIFSPISGILIDLISNKNGYPDYCPAFYLFNGFALLTALITWVLDIPMAMPLKNVMKNFKKLFHLREVVVFLGVVLFLGMVWGFIESFLFWYLLDLGSSKYLLGLTLTTGAIIGLPFLHNYSGLVKKIGKVNILIFAFLIYCIRCIGYSYINSPWWCLLFEAMEAFTYHLMWGAVSTYSATLVPKGLLATVQGCVGSLHYGLGKGVGSLVGGHIMNAIGARLAFRYIGIGAGIVGLLYGILYYCFLSRFQEAEEERKRKIETELKAFERSEDNENKGTQTSATLRDTHVITTSPDSGALSVQPELTDIDEEEEDNRTMVKETVS